jgi:hypothetical protein
MDFARFTCRLAHMWSSRDVDRKPLELSCQASDTVQNVDLLAMPKINRLFQPRNPLFWIMVVLNGLSALLGWLTHTYVMGSVVSLMLVGFAIGNALLGTYLAWRLVNS